ncbi:MAG: hypothetical protein WC277_01610 [Bacilli bacterium]
MKNILKKLLLIILFFMFINLNVNALDKVDVYFFYSNGCPHCASEKEMLDKLVKENKNIIIHAYEINDKDNYQLWIKKANELEANISGVPFTIIGEAYFTGYSESYNKNAIVNEINKQLIQKDNNINKNEEDNSVNENEEDNSINENDENNYNLDVPIVGKIKTENLSLPIIAILMGVLDGFNPCAMWILLFLISILIGMNDRKKMWILGLTFVATSALMYSLFMIAWLNLALFMGSLSWIRILVAGVAIIGGIINLKSGLNKDSGCRVVNDKKREKIFSRVKRLTSEKTFLLALGGIILLAISVNLIELLCSAGLPVVFTQILALNELSSIDHYLYILLYIIFFMIDDMIVFIIAMLTLKLTGISTKYGKISHLIGGILMIIIGLLLIFNPGLLMFN